VPTLVRPDRSGTAIPGHGSPSGPAHPVVVHPLHVSPLPLRTADGHHLDERRTSWLELFFDLVFAGAVGQLAGALQVHPILSALARFAMIFAHLVAVGAVVLLRGPARIRRGGVRGILAAVARSAAIPIGPRAALYGGVSICLLATIILPSRKMTRGRRAARLATSVASMGLVFMGAVVLPVYLVPALTVILALGLAAETHPGWLLSSIGRLSSIGCPSMPSDPRHRQDAGDDTAAHEAPKRSWCLPV